MRKLLIDKAYKSMLFDVNWKYYRTIKINSIKYYNTNLLLEQWDLTKSTTVTYTDVFHKTV